MLYDDSLSLKEKIETVAKEIYGADGVTYSPAAERELKRITDLGMGDFPVCMAKTQYSLSDDAKKLGRPSGFKINVREVYASAGAGFVVAVNGSIMTMPGLSKKPAAYGIDVDDNGVITFKNAKKLKEVVEYAPLSQIVLETDSPYLSPEPNRGKRNDSRNLIFVAREIAQIKGITEEEVIAVTEENAEKLLLR